VDSRYRLAEIHACGGDIVSVICNYSLSVGLPFAFFCIVVLRQKSEEGRASACLVPLFMAPRLRLARWERLVQRHQTQSVHSTPSSLQYSQSLLISSIIISFSLSTSNYLDVYTITSTPLPTCTLHYPRTSNTHLYCGDTPPRHTYLLLHAGAVLRREGFLRRIQGRGRGRRESGEAKDISRVGWETLMLGGKANDP